MPLFLKTSRYSPNQPFFLHAFHLECSRIRVRPAVESKSMLMPCGDQVNGTSVQLVLLEAHNEGAEGATLAKGCARNRGAASCVAAEAALVQMVCAREYLCRGQKEDEKINGNENMIKTKGNLRGREGYVIYKIVKL